MVLSAQAMTVSSILQTTPDTNKCSPHMRLLHRTTNPIEHNDPGGVLHLGVGDVHFGFFIVDDVMYSGPVFSSYEFLTPIDERLTDDEFKARVDGKTSKVSPPEWALASYLC